MDNVKSKVKYYHIKDLLLSWMEITPFFIEICIWCSQNEEEPKGTDLTTVSLYCCRWSSHSTGHALTSPCAPWLWPVCSVHRALSLWVWTHDTSTFTCPQLTSPAWIWTPTQSPSMWRSVATLSCPSRHHRLMVENVLSGMMKVAPFRFLVSLGERLSCNDNSWNVGILTVQAHLSTITPSH